MSDVTSGQSSSGKNNPVPLTIVTGFLGSGKTTLINYLLNEIGDTEKLAIIKNEIGDIAVDSKIIRGENIVMKELLNGCVCCTLVGELEESLEELVNTVRPDRIIIEASGAANPAILAVNIDRLDFVKRGLIVTIVDVLNFEGYKDKTIVGRLQHKFTDLVVLNRVGEVDKEVIENVLDDIYDVRPGIPVIKTVTGRVNPDVLFGLRDGRKRIELSVNEDLHKHHLHEDEIETFSYRSERRLKEDCFEKVLQGLSEEYYRIKGFVWLDGKDQIHLVNFVCGRYEIEPISAEVEANIESGQNKIVFIGKRIGRYESKVLSRIKKCEKK